MLRNLFDAGAAVARAVCGIVAAVVLASCRILAPVGVVVVFLVVTVAAFPAAAQDAVAAVDQLTGGNAGVWALIIIIVRQLAEFGSKFIPNDAAGGMGVLRTFLRAIAVYRPAK